jgi:hypothetical protein
MISLIFLCSPTTCRKKKYCPKDSHDKIYIVNNSNIAVNWINNDDPNDTIWRNNGQFPDVNFNLIYPYSTDKVAIGLEKCWEYYYQGGHQNYYFIFHHDTIKKIGWQKVSGTNRGLLKRIKVDLNYLKNNNFTLTYP